MLTVPDFVAIRGASNRARRLAARLAAVNAAIRRTAHTVGAVLVDIAATPEAADPASWSNDRLHPSAAGYDFIASLAWEAIEPIVARKLSLGRDS